MGRSQSLDWIQIICSPTVVVSLTWFSRLHWRHPRRGQACLRVRFEWGCVLFLQVVGPQSLSLSSPTFLSVFVFNNDVASYYHHLPLMYVTTFKPKQLNGLWLYVPLYQRLKCTYMCMHEWRCFTLVLVCGEEALSFKCTVPDSRDTRKLMMFT